MTTTTVSPERFRAEAERRLVDTFELMLLLGLRSRESVWSRVRKGTLPAPVLNRPSTIALWDRDELDLPDGKEQK
jgi:predicted DNA-binding transcriptional regulator AlpA